MSEIEIARIVFLAFFALLLGFVFALPRSYIFRGAPDKARWRDLRLWALVLVAVHGYVYWVFA